MHIKEKRPSGSKMFSVMDYNSLILQEFDVISTQSLKVFSKLNRNAIGPVVRSFRATEQQDTLFQKLSEKTTNQIENMIKNQADIVVDEIPEQVKLETERDSMRTIQEEEFLIKQDNYESTELDEESEDLVMETERQLLERLEEEKDPKQLENIMLTKIKEFSAHKLIHEKLNEYFQLFCTGLARRGCNFVDSYFLANTSSLVNNYIKSQ